MKMNNFDAILLMAGKGIRFNKGVNKTLYQSKHKPIFLHALKPFLEYESLSKLFLVVNEDDLTAVKKRLIDEGLFDRVIFVKGGNSRAESVRNALTHVLEDIVIIHDLARPWIEKEDISLILTSLKEADASTFYHDVNDTIKLVDGQIETLPRNLLKAVSTPQAFSKKTYHTLLNPSFIDELITDEIKLVEKTFSINFVKERHSHIKITTLDDIAIYETLRYGNDSVHRIGQSFDFHPFVSTRPLILGGIKLDYPLGLAGHSDADVLFHAVSESIIGALGLGDLGTLFPDNDMNYLNIASSYFLTYMEEKLIEHQYKILNIDIMIYLEKPNLTTYKKQMAYNIAQYLKIKPELVNVKATSMEKKGRIGKGEGIACEAIVLLGKITSSIN